MLDARRSAVIAGAFRLTSKRTRIETIPHELFRDGIPIFQTDIQKNKD